MAVKWGLAASLSLQADHIVKAFQWTCLSWIRQCITVIMLRLATCLLLSETICSGPICLDYESEIHKNCIELTLCSLDRLTDRRKSTFLTCKRRFNGLKYRQSGICCCMFEPTAFFRKKQMPFQNQRHPSWETQHPGVTLLHTPLPFWLISHSNAQFWFGCFRRVEIDKCPWFIIATRFHCLRTRKERGNSSQSASWWCSLIWIKLTRSHLGSMSYHIRQISGWNQQL